MLVEIMVLACMFMLYSVFILRNAITEYWILLLTSLNQTSNIFIIWKTYTYYFSLPLNLLIKKYCTFRTKNVILRSFKKKTELRQSHFAVTSKPIPRSRHRKSLLLTFPNSQKQTTCVQVLGFYFLYRAF